MLSMNEYEEVASTVEELDDMITDDIIDRADFYTIEEDIESLLTELVLYDNEENKLITVKVEDYLTAIAYVEETFEIDEIEDLDEDESVKDDYNQYD